MKLAVCFLFLCVAFVECAVVTLPSAAAVGTQNVSSAAATDSTVYTDVEEGLIELGQLTQKVEYLLHHLSANSGLQDGEMVPYGFFDEVGKKLKQKVQEALEEGKEAMKQAIAKSVEEILDTKMGDILEQITESDD